MQQLSSKLFLFFFTTILITLFLPSCCCDFYDDLTKCKTPHLLFSYQADGTEEVLNQYIHSGKLFVYDDKGELYMEKELTTNDLEEGVYLENIHSGKWDIIAWGNVGSYTKIENNNSLTEAVLSTLPNKENNLFQTTDSLYVARFSLNVKELPKDGKVTLSFASAHISFDVLIKDFDSFKSNENSTIQLAINKAGTQYIFADITKEKPISITPHPFFPILKHSSKENIYRARFELFRIENMDNLTLNINEIIGEQSITRKPIPLFDYLAENRIPFQGRNEVNIPIMVIFKGNLDIHIEPFEWGIINLIPDDIQ